jgi:hypothetical protein
MPVVTHVNLVKNLLSTPLLIRGKFAELADKVAAIPAGSCPYDR